MKNRKIKELLDCLRSNEELHNVELHSYVKVYFFICNNINKEIASTMKIGKGETDVKRST
jgi:hypothetical protein